MKKRLRKKLYLDEFAVKGFEFSVSLASFNDDQFDSFFDALAEFIHSKNLEITGGGTQDKFNAYVASGDRYGSATDEDRTAVETWLNEQDGVSDVAVEALSDANYD